MSLSLETPVLKVENLSVAYKVRGGEVTAVQNVSFQVERGEAYGIVGESGCGKSTLAWAILNFLGRNGYIKQGSIQFQGQELTGQSDEALRRLRGDQIAMVYQDPMQALNPSMRLGEQMMEVLIVHRKMAKEAAKARCLQMLAQVHMPDPAQVMRRYPHEISGGQQQRVVIGMALLNNPALLIMDEPTTALDVTVEAAVLSLIDELRQELDTAILYISHNLGVVARVCTQVGVMYAGELAERAPVEPLFSVPRHPYTQGLLRCVPRLGTSKGGHRLQPIPGRVPPPEARPCGCVFAPRCGFAEKRCWEERPLLRPLTDETWVRCHLAEEIAQGNVGRDTAVDGPSAITEAKQGQHPTPTKKPILSVNGLKKYYPVAGGGWRDLLNIGQRQQIQALEEATFDVAHGTTLGVVGESGCGKSTLIKTLVGLADSTAGEARFLSFDLTERLEKRDEQLLQALQMVFQNPDATLNPAYTVGQQIARPIKRFHLVPAHQVRGEVVRLLEAVRLGEAYYDRLPQQLSGGEKQRVGIARALASRPELLLCDEPVSALDVSVQAAILNLLLDVQGAYGTTMIFVAHDLSVVRFFSDYIAVMYLGQVMAFGMAESIYAPPYHPYTEALLAAVPVPDPTAVASPILLHGEIPSPISPPTGCRFHTRCPKRHLLPDGGKICAQETPPWRQVSADHRVFCHLSLEQENC